MATEKASVKIKERLLTCGLIMPISAIDGCSAEHWAEVKSIITEAIESIEVPRFTAKLVSDADDVGVIQKRIVQNIYSSDIVICDVSGKNPNVMFELGMRLAFDKPTVIIKDDKTDYSFDTGIIEHVPYPRDLRFSRIVTFKNSLSEKVYATHRAAASNPDQSTFLKNFGKFQVANLAEAIVPTDKLVLDMLSELQSEVSRLRRSIPRESMRRSGSFGNPEVSAKIVAAIDAFRRENPQMSLNELLGAPDFFQEIEMRINGPRYFVGPTECREAIEMVAREMTHSME